MRCVHEYKLSVCFWLMLVLSFPDTVCSCGEAMSGRRGELKTPNYPGDYDNDLNCTWTIAVDTRDTITVIFKGFLVEAYFNGGCADHFYVYDGPNGSSTVLLHACGHRKPEPIVSSGDSLTFALITDDTQTLAGVRLIWRVSDKFTLHTNPVSWPDANAACLKEGGYLVVTHFLSDLYLTKLLSNFSGRVWFGDYLTPWVWLKGCYKDKDGNFIPGKYYSESKHSLLQHCQFRCQDSVYFGLQGRKCLCLTSEDMDHLVLSRPVEECKMSCPGDSDGLCGGKSALTVFMNDVCWKNSSTWTGRISRTISGRECQPWKFMSPHAHSFHGDQMFPDISEDTASNYCRDPSGKGLPWCCTMDTEVPWQFCDVPPCAENANPKDITDSDALCRVYWTNGSSFLHQQNRCSQNESFACFLDDRGLKTFIVSSQTDFYSAAWKGCRHLYGLADYKLFYDLTEKAGVQNAGSHYWVGSLRTADNTKDKDSVPTPSMCKTIRHQKDELQIEAQASCDLRFGFVCQKEAILCGENLSAEDGYITWPVNQTRYNINENCLWEITVSKERSITMTFLHVDLEASNTCSYDFIEVSETSVNGPKRLHTLCGKATNITVSSSHNVVRIRFKSDSDTTGSGFQLKWWSELNPTTTMTTPMQSTKPSHLSTLHNSERVTNAVDDANYSIGVGAVAGIVAGILVILALVIVLTVLLLRRMKLRARNHEATKQQTNVYYNENINTSDTRPHDLNRTQLRGEIRDARQQPSAENVFPESDAYNYINLNVSPSCLANGPVSSNSQENTQTGTTGNMHDHVTDSTGGSSGEAYADLDESRLNLQNADNHPYMRIDTGNTERAQERAEYDYVDAEVISKPKEDNQYLTVLG